MVKLQRETGETRIELELELYGRGEYDINTGIGFFDHMLELWTRHGFFDLKLKADGDLEVDCHHTVEDTGIVLGQALDEALGARKSIKRYGEVILPMDEVLVLTAVDLSGRSYYKDDLKFENKVAGNFPVELFSEFYSKLVSQAGINLHFKMLRGGNTHHLLEACFKGFARTLDKALQIEQRLENESLSTKGKLGEGE